MIYVLDTDVLTLIARGDSREGASIRARIADLSDQDSVVTTIINYEEQMRGWMALLARGKTSRAEIQIYGRLHELITIFQRATILPYTATAAALFEAMRGQKIRLGSMDLKIAAITMSVGATLVTRNVSDFRLVAGLRFEIW